MPPAPQQWGKQMPRQLRFSPGFSVSLSENSRNFPIDFISNKFLEPLHFPPFTTTAINSPLNYLTGFFLVFLHPFLSLPPTYPGFPCGSDGIESTWNVGDLGLIPGLGRSPGGENSYPLQHSGLENSTDCTVHRVAKSRTWLNDFHIAIYPPQYSKRDFFFMFIWSCHLFA